MNAMTGLATFMPEVPEKDPAALAREKDAKAAKDFESLLIDQILKAAHSDESDWLGTGDDDASSTAFGLGEEQLATAMANGGGFGLQKLITQGLRQKAAPEEQP